MKAYIIREMTYLKLLQPLINKGDIVYYLDKYLGAKNYNRATADKLAYLETHNYGFKDDTELLKLINKHNINIVVSVELGLQSIAPKIKHLETHNYLYLTDSMWDTDPKHQAFTKVFYFDSYIKHKHLSWKGLVANVNRDFIYQPLVKTDELKNIETILLPNLSKEQLIRAFGSEGRFVALIDSLVGSNTHLKARRKQYIPTELLKYHIVMDEENYWPTTTNKMLNKSKLVYMFNSSAVFECLYLGVPVINYKIPLEVWRWDKAKLKEHFNGVIYNNNLVKSKELK